MRAGVKVILVVTFVASLVFSLALTNKPVVASPGLRMSVNPARLVDTGKTAGTTFTVQVNITSDPGVNIQCYSYAFKLRWYGPLLDVTDVVDGGYFPAAYSSFGSSNYNGPDPIGELDYIAVGNTLLPSPGDPGWTPYQFGINGSGILATITFKVESLGQTAFQLYDEGILNLVGTSLVHTPENGYFSNQTWASKGYPGDATGDHKVDIADLQAVFKSMGTTSGYPPGTNWGEYNSAADFNSDGKVNVFDLYLVGINYGQPL